MATTKHKKGKKHKSKHDNAGEGMAPGTEAAHPETDQPRMSAKEFNKALKPLQVELVKLQAWVKATGAKVCIVFEGRDAAGKGGTIKRIRDRVSPRVFPIVALPAPTEREKSQMYIQRYVPHLPAAGEVVIFDRSWYNRAGVERVMGFATEQQVDEFLSHVIPFERAMIASGIILIKYWLEVSQEEQTRRFEDRIDRWAQDLEAESDGSGVAFRWYDYSRARDAMFAATDTADSPWYVVDSNEKRRGRLNCISHLLSLVPYEEIPMAKSPCPSASPPTATSSRTTRTATSPSGTEADIRAHAPGLVTPCELMPTGGTIRSVADSGRSIWPIGSSLPPQPAWSKQVGPGECVNGPRCPCGCE